MVQLAKLEIMITIDEKRFDELTKQRYSDWDLMRSIEKSISLTDTVSGNIPTPPVLDIKSVRLLKYY